MQWVVLRTVASLWFVVACGRFDFDALGDGGAGSSGSNGSNGSASNGSSGSNGSNGGGPPPGCISPGIGDTFEEALPCMSWGSPIISNAMVATSNGQLTITTSAVAMAAGGCTLANVPFGAAGVFAQIDSLPLNSVLELEITDSSGTSWSLGSVGGTDVGFSEANRSLGFGLWNPSTSSWWRLRPSGGVVAFEVSGDGTTWTTEELGTLPAPTTVSATIQLSNNLAAADTGVVDGIDVCP